jgi:cytochrome bd-type quinol oxidase subunit 2
MNTPADAQTKALEFVHQASLVTLIATIALLAWVASGVDFSNDSLRFGAMACLTLSIVFGAGTLALVPLVAEARRPGQSNFDVAPAFHLFGRRSARLKTVALPQYALLLAGIVLYVIGMID